MKLVAFSVRNYRSIQSTPRIALSELTVLVGPNNEGKSNLLSALVCALSLAQERNPTARRTLLGGVNAPYQFDRDFPIGLRDAKKKVATKFELEFELDADDTSKLFIVGWWLTGLAALVALAGAEFATTFALLWLVARASVFHLITTFREMCDHFGLRPGGVFTFTRDMACHGFWRQFIHPRNNGYHLTHHLLPAVPYYRLPEAHRLFRQMSAYQAKAHVCHSYFAGEHAVTRAWQASEPQ